MPRRPRPVSRRPPVHAAQQLAVNRETGQKSGYRKLGAVRQAQQSDEKSTSTSGSEDINEERDEDSGVSDVDTDHEIQTQEAEEPGFDLDDTRVAQWVDDEELEEASQGESDPESNASGLEAGRSTHGAEDALASLSFGTLRKAQKELARTSVLDSADEGLDSDEESEAPLHYDAKGKGRDVDAPLRHKKSIPKRPHKHAPTEVSSKKPVSRKKLVVEVEKAVVPRDPRFLPMTGEFSAQRFRSQYGFLGDLHNQEMQTLRENLKRARKLLINSPRHGREERQQEVQRLERAYKRAESMVSKDRQESIQQEALEKVAKEEKEKRKAGKGAWYMKNSDKKDLLLRAKYEALAASGGRSAVKRAIDKRQKKASQKDKKKRPFAPGSAGMPRKRSTTAHGDDQRSGKRRRVG